MNRIACSFFFFVVVGLIGCSADVRVTVLTEPPPTGNANLVNRGTREVPDPHLVLSKAIAVALECSEIEYGLDFSYGGPCRELSIDVDDDDVVTSRIANLDALGGSDNYGQGYVAATTASRTGLVLIGASPGTTVVHVKAKSASLDIEVEVDNATDVVVDDSEAADDE